MTNLPNDKTYALFQTPRNKTIINRLKDRGAAFFLFPAVETEQVTLDEIARLAVKNLDRIDWIVFTDVFAVEYFLQILDGNEIDYYELDKLSVCAVGEAVADSLRFSQIHADVIPFSVETEEIFQSLTKYIADEDLGNLKFLLLRSDSAGDKLAFRLLKANASVVEIALYKFAVSDFRELTKLKVLLGGGAIDEFIISAPEDLIALKNFYADDFEAALKEVKMSAIGETVFQAIKEYKLKPHNFYLPKEN